eukprot:UN14195
MSYWNFQIVNKPCSFVKDHLQLTKLSSLLHPSNWK